MAALPLQTMISQATTFNKSLRRREYRLGDGYSQRVQDGLNALKWKGSIVWENLTEAELDTLTAFIDGIGSWGTFDYTPPGANSASKFSVNDDGPQITAVSGQHYNLTIAVQEEFDL